MKDESLDAGTRQGDVENPRCQWTMCCKAYTAECMSCTSCVSIDEFCASASHARVPGCTVTEDETDIDDVSGGGSNDAKELDDAKDLFDDVKDTGDELVDDVKDAAAGDLPEKWTPPEWKRPREEDDMAEMVIELARKCMQLMTTTTTDDAASSTECEKQATDLMASFGIKDRGVVEDLKEQIKAIFSQTNIEGCLELARQYSQCGSGRRPHHTSSSCDDTERNPFRLNVVSRTRCTARHIYRQQRDRRHRRTATRPRL